MGHPNSELDRKDFDYISMYNINMYNYFDMHECELQTGYYT